MTSEPKSLRDDTADPSEWAHTRETSHAREKRTIRITDKLTISLSAATFCLIFSAISGGAFTIGGGYQSWTKWREMMTQFVHDQRDTNKTFQESLDEIKARLPVQHVEAQ